MAGVDTQSLTLGEVARIEELSGQPISAIADADAPKGKAMAALVFVMKRRHDPKYTWNQACGVTFEEASEILGLDDDDEDDADGDAVAEIKAANGAGSGSGKARKK